MYKSVDQGTTWVAASGALAGIAQFTVLKVAQSDTQVLYAGSGTKLYRTTNGGGAWTDITSGLPVATNFLTHVAINDTNPDIAYATFSGYVAGEKVYRTLNGGGSWTNISGTLPNMPSTQLRTRRALTMLYTSAPMRACTIGMSSCPTGFRISSGCPT